MCFCAGTLTGLVFSINIFWNPGVEEPWQKFSNFVCFDVLGRKSKLKVHTIVRLLAITVKMLLMNERW